MHALSRVLRAKSANLQRANHFAKLQAADVDYFRSVTGVLTESSDGPSSLDRYNKDWLGVTEGHSTCVLRPQTTEEVSKILRHCNARKLAVVPQGGNTGLVGGSVPVFDEIVLSLEKMNSTINIDEHSGVAVFEAGKVLETANNELAEKKLLFPLDLGSKGSCQLGGNISTNAGGLRLLRYGNLHGNVVGVEFVKADGEVVDVLSKNKKDNTGLDLKQLMIGSEGLLGVVTKVAVNCPPLPVDKNLLLAGVKTYEDCVRVFGAARRDLGEILSAFEFIDPGCVQLGMANLKLTPPEFLSVESRFGVLIETSGGNGEHDSEKLYAFLEKFGESLEGTVASGGQQQKQFWEMRERLAEALLHDGYCYKYDVSVPDIADIYKIVEECKRRLSDVPGVVRVVGYGHMGDGNLHLNITSAKFDERVLGEIEPWLWEITQEYGGSISAEHGIGLVKVDALKYSKSAAAIETMKDLKRLMDPNGILNPYKVLDGMEYASS